MLVADDEVHGRWVRPLSPGGEPVDTFGEAVAAGAHYARCTDLDELVATLASWGLPPANVRASLESFALAAEGSTAAVLDAPIPTDPQPVRTPPLHALEVQPSITFSFSGLWIDDRARVLDRDPKPIPNLYAAGADAGGLNNIGYAGGLGWH